MKNSSSYLKQLTNFRTPKVKKDIRVENFPTRLINFPANKDKEKLYAVDDVVRNHIQVVLRNRFLAIFARKAGVSHTYTSNVFKILTSQSKQGQPVASLST